jgi:hypothetical protein
MGNSRTYLGDGVYVEFDCGQLWLSVDNGAIVPGLNAICLESEVLERLNNYHKSQLAIMEKETI